MIVERLQNDPRRFLAPFQDPVTPRLDRRLGNLAALKSYFRRHTSDTALVLAALSQTYYVCDMQSISLKGKE